MWEVLWLLLLIVFLASAIIAGALLWRNYVDGGSTGVRLFRNKTEKRLEVIDQAAVDGRRKLVLIRRDNTEHLIMTGGPVDVVIETGIGLVGKSRGGEIVEPVFARKSRALGQASGDK